MSVLAHAPMGDSRAEWPQENDGSRRVWPSHGSTWMMPFLSSSGQSSLLVSLIFQLHIVDARIPRRHRLQEYELWMARPKLSVAEWQESMMIYQERRIGSYGLLRHHLALCRPLVRMDTGRSTQPEVSSISLSPARNSA